MVLFLELLVRSSVLLAAAEGLRWLFRHCSATLRHRLLLWALALLAMLPVFLVALPEFPIFFHSALPKHAAVTVTQTILLTRAPAAQPVHWLAWIWLTGFLCSLVPLALDGLLAHRILRHAAPETGTNIFFSKDVNVPLTCGIFRSRILLPDNARTWTSQRIAAVLLHERAHIERRDVFLQSFARVIAALWWFQPLVWLTKRHLRTESELACDHAALASGMLPSQYATELLAIAQGLNRTAFSAPGISMARPSDLERRLSVILKPARQLLPKGGVWPEMAFLLILTMAVSTVTADTNIHSFHQGGFFMRRSILAVLLASSGLSAATISGSISDTNGTALSNARLTLTDPDNGQKFEATSDAAGKFALPNAPGGEYILRVEKDGYETLLRAFNLKDDSVIDRSLTLGVDPGGHNRPGAGRIRIGGQVAQSNLIEKVQPVYPPSAKKARITGTVELYADISKDGVPEELSIVRSPDEALSESALNAVRQWRYRPVLLNGQPVAISTDIVVNYTLSE